MATGQRIAETFKGLAREGKTVVVVSHDDQVVARLIVLKVMAVKAIEVKAIEVKSIAGAPMHMLLR